MNLLTPSFPSWFPYIVIYINKNKYTYMNNLTKKYFHLKELCPGREYEI